MGLTHHGLAPSYTCERNHGILNQVLKRSNMLLIISLILLHSSQLITIISQICKSATHYWASLHSAEEAQREIETLQCPNFSLRIGVGQVMPFGWQLRHCEMAAHSSKLCFVYRSITPLSLCTCVIIFVPNINSTCSSSSTCNIFDGLNVHFIYMRLSMLC